MASRRQAVAASLFHTEWKDLSDPHEEKRETLEKLIGNFPHPQKPLYIVGAIGSGKTELLYHGFRFTWTQTDLPALCVTMSQLLNDILSQTGVDPDTGQITQAEIYDAIESVCFAELEQIAEYIEQDEELAQTDYLPDAPPDKSRTSAYFGHLFDENIDENALESLADQARSEYFILHVDEIEETYDRLDEVIEGHQGPLREVVNKIANGTASFYFVGSFAYASIQELGQAEGRRTQNLNLPIIRPDDAREILGESDRSQTLNLAWWAARGRPGWLSNAVDEVDITRGEFDGLYDDLDMLLPSQISNVDLLATQPLESHLDSRNIDSAGRDLLTYLLLNPGPIEISEFADPEQVYEILQKHRELPVYTENELLSLDSVLTMITDDIKDTDLYDEYGDRSRVLRQYLKRVLNGVADENGALVFGDVLATIPNRDSRFKELLAGPLTERAHDIALEEVEKESDEIEFLYQLSQYTGNLDIADLKGAYPDAINEFADAPRDVRDIEYVSVSLESLRTAFPSLITNPILNFRGRSLGKSRQVEELAENLRTIGHRHRRLTQFGALFQEGVE